MDVKTFLELFFKELEISPDLREYYRVLNNKGRMLWRKAYFEQRLDYVVRHLGEAPENIWDAGCGYATTSIFLALNGYVVMGNTLEFYYDQIGRRLDYWSRHGNLDNLKIEYANLFDMPVRTGHYHAIIAQDTLHHLEPVHQAIDIFSISLQEGGRLVVTEENANHPFIALKNFSKRGFNRVTDYYDQRLGKHILFGNENARNLNAWKKIIHDSGLTLPDQEIEYIRFLPPGSFNHENYTRKIAWEQRMAKHAKMLRDYLFFGINFTAVKQS
jgi:SAM-dependent methyltransferase